MEKNGAVRLFLLVCDPVFNPAAIQALLVGFDLQPHLLDGGVVADFLLQLKMDGLQKAGRFDAFHRLYSSCGTLGPSSVGWLRQT